MGRWADSRTAKESPFASQGDAVGWGSAPISACHTAIQARHGHAVPPERSITTTYVVARPLRHRQAQERTCRTICRASRKRDFFAWSCPEHGLEETYFSDNVPVPVPVPDLGDLPPCSTERHTCLWSLRSSAPDKCREPLLKIVVNFQEQSSSPTEPISLSSPASCRPAAKRSRQQVLQPSGAPIPKILPRRYPMTSVLPTRTNAPAVSMTRARPSLVDEGGRDRHDCTAGSCRDGGIS